MRSLPSACGPFDGHPLAEWIRSYRTLEALDFDLLLGGHGSVAFTRKDLVEGREFFEYLLREVDAAMRRGEPAASTIAAVTRQLLRASPGARRQRILWLSSYWPALLRRALEAEYEHRRRGQRPHRR